MTRQDASGCISTYEESDKSNIVLRVFAPSTTTESQVNIVSMEQNDENEAKKQTKPPRSRESLEFLGL